MAVIRKKCVPTKPLFFINTHCTAEDIFMLKALVYVKNNVTPFFENIFLADFFPLPNKVAKGEIRTMYNTLVFAALTPVKIARREKKTTP